jgi:outer membrane protein
MRTALCGLFWFIGVAICTPARADVVKLAELEASALSHRHELDANEARVRQAKAQIAQAKSAYWPQLGAVAEGSLSPGRQLIDLRDYVPTLDEPFLISGSQGLEDPATAFLPQPRYGASVTARGNLYDFGRTSAAISAANAKQRATEADGRARTDAVLREVRAGYVRWALAQALWQVADEARVRAEQQEARVSGLIAEGAVPTGDRTAALSQSNAARLEAERAALELETARLDLTFATGRTLAAEAVPEPELLQAPPPSAAAPKPTPVDLAVLAVEQAREAARARAHAQGQNRSPVLGYRASIGFEGQTSSGIEGVDTKVFPSYALGVSLSVPLWDGGGTAAAEAHARAEVAELSAEAAAERARAQHLATRRSAQATHSARILSLAERALQLAEARIAQLEGGESLGSAERAALLAAEAERSEARANLVRAQAQLAQLRLGLL